MSPEERLHYRQLARRGLHLARQGRGFAAHEVWEELWLELHGDERLWLQALIQLAVSQLHRDSGNQLGSASLREKAAVKLSRLATEGFPEPEWAAGLELPLPKRLLELLAGPDPAGLGAELWSAPH